MVYLTLELRNLKRVDKFENLNCLNLSRNYVSDVKVL